MIDEDGAMVVAYIILGLMVIGLVIWVMFDKKAKDKPDKIDKLWKDEKMSRLCGGMKEPPKKLSHNSKGVNENSSN